MTTRRSPGKRRPTSWRTEASLYDEARKAPADRGDFGPCDDDWKLVKRVEATRTGGRASSVYVRRLPAHFWRLVSGDIEITTGSGGEIAELIERLARALAAGAVRFESVGGAEMHLTGSGRGAKDLVAAFEAERSRDMVGFRGLGAFPLCSGYGPEPKAARPPGEPGRGRRKAPRGRAVARRPPRRAGR